MFINFLRQSIDEDNMAIKHLYSPVAKLKNQKTSTNNVNTSMLSTTDFNCN
jgi:hypothetical protein